MGAVAFRERERTNILTGSPSASRVGEEFTLREIYGTYVCFETGVETRRRRGLSGTSALLEGLLRSRPLLEKAGGPRRVLGGPPVWDGDESNVPEEGAGAPGVGRGSLGVGPFWGVRAPGGRSPSVGQVSSPSTPALGMGVSLVVGTPSRFGVLGSPSFRDRHGAHTSAEVSSASGGRGILDGGSTEGHFTQTSGPRSERGLSL